MKFVLIGTISFGLYLLYRSFKKNTNEVFDIADANLKKEQDKVDAAIDGLKPKIEDNRSDKEIEDYYSKK